jgi:hypothetical protein
MTIDTKIVSLALQTRESSLGKLLMDDEWLLRCNKCSDARVTVTVPPTKPPTQNKDGNGFTKCKGGTETDIAVKDLLQNQGQLIVHYVLLEF